jgi:hypothetical protein
MATALPTGWDFSGGQTSLGNPVDMGPWRNVVQNRGQVYDTRSNDQYDWAKSQFAKNAGITDEVQKRALDTGAMFTDWSKADRALYDTSYVPAMKEQLDYARSYTTPERMAANRAAAQTGTNITFDAAADMAKRALMGYGVDPSSGRFAGLDAGLAAKRAATAAGAGTKSDRDTEMMGQQLLANAIRTGQVLPGQAANEAGVSLAANNQAVNTGLATTASGAQTMGTGLQWAGMGDDMMKAWADSMFKQTQLGMQQNRDVAEQELARQKMAQGSSSGIGGALGVAAPLLKMGGSMAMNYFTGGAGGAMMGGGAGPLAGAGSGTTFRKGGPVRKFQRGGMVIDEQGNPIREPEFDPEGEGYDYDQARAAGMGPDEEGHWQSREPGSGMMLKGRKHPTFNKGVEEDRKLGYGLEKQGGRYYTKPFKRYYAGGALGEEQGYDDSWDDWTNKAGVLSSYDPTGYGGFATDAIDIAGDIGGGADHDVDKGDVLGIFPDSELDQGEQIGGSTGSLVGRAIGAIWGVPGLGAMAGRDLGEGIGAMVQGRVGEGFENIGRNAVTSLTSGGGMGGMMGAFAEGGSVPEDDEMFVDTPDEGMGEEPSNMVPPEASPSNGEETDDVHALLNEGEFVIPKDVTSWFGEKFFQNLIQKAYKEKSAAQAEGEPVSPQQQQAIQMSPPSFESMGA